jgi:hypothetical protein
VSKPGVEVDIARNIKTVEWLKAELVSSVGVALKSIFRGGEEAVLDALAGVIVTTSVLARRFGLSFSKLDAKVEAKIRQYISDGHETEKWYGDLTSLLRHLEDRPR